MTMALMTMARNVTIFLTPAQGKSRSSVLGPRTERVRLRFRAVEGVQAQLCCGCQAEFTKSFLFHVLPFANETTYFWHSACGNQLVSRASPHQLVPDGRPVCHPLLIHWGLLPRSGLSLNMWSMPEAKTGGHLPKTSAASRWTHRLVQD